MMELQRLMSVYGRLGDELSREIYMYRIMFSISGEEKWLTKLARTNTHIKDFIDLLKRNSGKIVVMGAGYRGRQLVHLNRDVAWKCFIDNSPKEDIVEGIPVYKTKDFLKNYAGELVIIASRVYEEEMYEQLRECGVSEENIICYGKILEKLIHDQYFDLLELPIADDEIFVDCGCFDAMTDTELKKRIGNRLKMVVAFEPDAERIRVCKKKFEEEQIKYTLVEKGAWSEETVLHFTIADSGMLTMSNEGETVNVTTVDRVLAGEKATFIKMDIEGSELEALKGCENTIKKYKPKLAICVYHKPEDIFEIPELILRYCTDYRFFLRHYSPHYSETVLYAIPV